MVSRKGALKAELEQFHRTQNYHRSYTGLVYTDGVHYLADRTGCYWLIDLVSSYQLEFQHVRFQLWEIEVVEGVSAQVTMRKDIDQPVYVRKHLPYTDFPLEKFSFYCVENVMMLKSEYKRRPVQRERQENDLMSGCE